MKKAIFLFGLPCSGKSTYYKEHIEEQILHHYINADEIKKEFADYDETVEGMYSSEAIGLAEERVKEAFKSGQNVVMDAGGINNSYTLRILQAAKDAGYETHMIHIDTPYDVCIARNKVRARKVPVDVITAKEYKRSFHWAKYQKSNLVDTTEVIPYFTEQHVFFDMDGVLAAQSSLPIVDGKIDFVNSNYFRHLPVVPQVAQILRGLQANGREIYILSAAPTSISAREKFSWLRENFPEIKESNIFFVNSGRYKAEMFNDLATRLKLDSKDMVLVEDTHEIIKAARREYKMHAIHVSELLTKYHNPVS